MRLEGIHHVTAITGDAPGNVDFYARVLGLRLVKKSVNQDDPTVYHLFYADEKGEPGSDITFFEYPNARPGRAGAGMVHRDRLARRSPRRSASGRAARRRRRGGRAAPTGRSRSRSRGPRARAGRRGTSDEPLIADHPGGPTELALQGFEAVRAYAFDPEQSRGFLEEALAFSPHGSASGRCAASSAAACYVYDRTEERGVGGAGTVHHVAWASPMDDHEAWRSRVQAAGASPTPVIDRFYFRSIYFREPSGVLFEIATIGPGFDADEPLEHLGERLSLPPNYEELRDRLEQVLTPLPDTRRQLATGGR